MIDTVDALVPSVASVPSVSSVGTLQPVADVPAYLAVRKPIADFAGEDHLYVTLPTGLRDEVRTLLAACKSAQSLVKGGLSVTKSCERAYIIYRARLSISLKSFREKFDTWSRSGDWVSLVNRTRAGAAWQDREDGLPDEFLKFCAKRFGQYKRLDAKRQALLAIKRQWITGRNSDGIEEPIPGYGFRSTNSQQSFPAGWSYSNILRQIKARNLMPTSVRLLLHQSTAAARCALPGVRFDRSALLFLQEVQFDDVKADFLIVDPETRQVCDLWLLVARDLATSILLGFGLRPARTREDGSQEHLRLRDMKQLCGWILERFGLPPYEMIWKIEHGTATLSEGSRAVLRELLPGRIDVSYSSMIGGQSPSGYAQRAIGNSKGKASLESHNRLMHTMLSDRPGQTGPLYTVRPADLQARAKETETILATTAHLPEHLQSRVGFPVLTLNQAREHLHRIFRLQNERTEHDLQGFEEVVEIWNGSAWVPQSQVESLSAAPQARTRKESPMERCARLVAPYREQWSAVSPEVIRAFYEHTARACVVKDNGHVEFRIDGNLVEFMPPPGALPQIPGTKLLGYFHPDDPAFLHLTDGHGRLLGTWLRRSRASDTASLQQAIRYTQSALSAAKAVADTYAADERAALDAMRARNAELLAANTFVETSGVSLSSQPSTLNSPIASALIGSRAAVKADAKKEKQDTRDARELLRKAADSF